MTNRNKAIALIVLTILWTIAMAGYSRPALSCAAPEPPPEAVVYVESRTWWF